MNFCFFFFIRIFPNKVSILLLKNFYYWFKFIFKKNYLKKKKKNTNMWGICKEGNFLEVHSK